MYPVDFAFVLGGCIIKTDIIIARSFTLFIFLAAFLFLLSFQATAIAPSRWDPWGKEIGLRNSRIYCRTI